ncbi:MAG: hypothetical protein ACYC2X_10720 [Coriobacteriia bacterium]
MKKRYALLCVLALAVALAVPGVANAADTSRYSALGASAFGEVWPDGAQTPELFVGVFGGTYTMSSRTPGVLPVRDSFQDVSVFADWPAADPEGVSTSVYGTLSPFDIGIDRNLTKAGVQAVIEGVRVTYTMQACPDQPDCWEQVTLSEEPALIEVDITWTGVGEVDKQRFILKEMTSDYSIMDRSNGRYRVAEVEGSIIIDGVNVTEGIKLIGDLSDSKGGSRIIGEMPYWE